CAFRVASISAGRLSRTLASCQSSPFRAFLSFGRSAGQTVTAFEIVLTTIGVPLLSRIGPRGAAKATWRIWLFCAWLRDSVAGRPAPVKRRGGGRGRPRRGGADGGGARPRGPLLGRRGGGRGAGGAGGKKGGGGGGPGGPAASQARVLLRRVPPLGAAAAGA